MDRHEAARKQIRGYLLRTNILFFSIAINILVFAGVVMVLTGFGAAPMVPPQDSGEISGYMIYLAPLSGLALVLLALRFYRTRLEQARKEEGLYHKMEGYRSALILRMALLDGAALVNLVAYMLNVQILHLGLAAIVLVMFIFQKPGLEKMIRELDVNNLEAQVLRDHAKRS